MIDKEFILEFKRRTEDQWRNEVISHRLAGFQFQRGTRWNPGLSEAEISRYETDLGFRFPSDVRLFLSLLNGTDTPTLNVYADCGEPYRTGPGVYTYPKDMDYVRKQVAEIDRNWKGIDQVLAMVDLEGGHAHLLPFYIHRYVVCGAEFSATPVLSICGTDAILYASSFRYYLEMEFLGGF